jgi:hypothetical protein
MKRVNDHRYGNISSFEDFRREEEILGLKTRIIEIKLSLTYLNFKKSFSPFNLLISIAKELILPKNS